MIKKDKTIVAGMLIARACELETRNPDGLPLKEIQMMYDAADLLDSTGNLSNYKIKEISQAAEENRCIILPVPFGSTFYYLLHRCKDADCPHCADPFADRPPNDISETVMDWGTMCFVPDWGECAFSTYEEAECALAAEQGK